MEGESECASKERERERECGRKDGQKSKRDIGGGDLWHRQGDGCYLVVAHVYLLPRLRVFACVVRVQTCVLTGGLGHVMTEETGFGVRASLSLVLDHWDDVANA